MIRRFFRLPALVALLLLPAGLQAQSLGEAPPPGGALQQAAWSGDWTGWGDQGSSQWSIDIVFLPTGDATIDYATIPCAGVLQLLKDDGKARMFRETILTDVPNCINDGLVTLTLLDDATLSFDWEGGGTRATGSLSRVGTP
ncbi:hypothetical protein [Maliponia aquimaris]|uniref:Alkaline proteinase inhibitor/ Outer membrane lipoprotein Omp19 domain-containing protein n=1 Tax=Maliponia aquimaris TaxID=1673631 RepID=A0A238KGF3_9RHOB|nr:hypothetical protein [Maliponia aquimaris]SMX41096.1 hypothetical protein MAA8898_02372 [Maliponia aquimaris]